MLRGFCGWTDPGPCPVCDAPHTTCTPASVAAQQRRGAVVAPVQRPRSLPPLEFTTATYTRATHGRAARGARARTEEP